MHVKVLWFGAVNLVSGQFERLICIWTPFLGILVRVVFRNFAMGVISCIALEESSYCQCPRLSEILSARIYTARRICSTIFLFALMTWFVSVETLVDAVHLE